MREPRTKLTYLVPQGIRDATKLLDLSLTDIGKRIICYCEKNTVSEPEPMKRGAEAMKKQAEPMKKGVEPMKKRVEPMKEERFDTTV